MRNFFLGVSIVICSTFSIFSQTVDPLDATWQQGQTTTVRLSISDKTGAMCYANGSYQYPCSVPITVIVTGPDRKEYRLTKTFGSVNNVEFLFPDEFDAHPTAGGTYQVQYSVNGKVVATNGFRWADSQEFAKWPVNPRLISATDRELGRSKVISGQICSIGLGSSGDGTFDIQTVRGKMTFEYFGSPGDSINTQVVGQKGYILNGMPVTIYYTPNNRGEGAKYDAIKIQINGPSKPGFKRCD